MDKSIPKISINILGFNHRDLLEAAINSVLAQSFKDFELRYTDNASADGSAAWVKKTFPLLNVAANLKNLGYAGGHNQFFAESRSEFLMVLNPDVVLDKEFLAKAITAFDDLRVGAVSGKLLRPSVAPALPKRGMGGVIDSCGIIINRSRRGRDRGQWEEDSGQYDEAHDIFGVSGAAAVFRRKVLEAVKIPNSTGYEYFDHDFFAYWEDLDLSWRIKLAGYTCRFVPEAIAYHKRSAGKSRGGYLKLLDFIKHHRNLSPQVKRWNWRNHLFCIIKNDFGWPLWRDFIFIAGRELAMLLFILIFETRTLAEVPDFFRLLPKMLAKRRYMLSRKTVSAVVAGTWFN